MLTSISWDRIATFGKFCCVLSLNGGHSVGGLDLSYLVLDFGGWQRVGLDWFIIGSVVVLGSFLRLIWQLPLYSCVDYSLETCMEFLPCFHRFLSLFSPIVAVAVVKGWLDWSFDFELDIYCWICIFYLALWAF